MAAVSSNDHNPYTDLDKDLNTIQSLIESLDPEKKGQGLISYDPEKNIFFPRTTILRRVRAFQAVSSLFDPNASIDNVIAGFEKSVETANKISQAIGKLIYPDNPSTATLIHYHDRLKEISKIIYTKSSPCVEELIKTYKSRTINPKDPENIGQLEECTQNLFVLMLDSYSQLNQHLSDEGLVEASIQVHEHEEIKEDSKGYEEAKRLVTEGEKYRATLIQVRYQSEVIIPSTLVDEVRDDCNWQKLISKMNLKEAALETKLFLNVPPLHAQKGNAHWIAMRIIGEDGEFKVTQNAIVGSCERDPKAPEKNHLLNFRLQILQNHIAITCGVIDTELKALEFCKGLFHALKVRGKQTPAVPFRLSLHQLNSFFNDHDLILYQHYFSRYIETILRKKLTPKFCEEYGIIIHDKIPIVAHINTSLNSAKNIPGEEQASRRQNLESLAAYALWISDSTDPGYQSIDPNELITLLKIITPFRKAVEEFIPLISNIKLVKESIYQLGPKDLSFGAEQSKLLKLQEELRSGLQKVALLANEIYLQFNDPSKILPVRVNFLLLKMRILSLLLAKQTTITKDSILKKTTHSILQKEIPHYLDNPHFKHFSRVTENELLLILDILLGVITEINCRSGIDRTNIPRSMWDALNEILHELMEDYPKETQSNAYTDLFNLVLNQDRVSEQINKYYQEFLKNTSVSSKISISLGQISNAAPYPTFRSDFIKYVIIKLEEEKRNSRPDELNKRDIDLSVIPQALHYQDLVALNFFAVGQIISLESTGITGLKYGHDKFHGTFTGNPHPMMRLPMFISTSDGKVIQLYTIGKITSRVFTEAGLQLILRCSQKRGD